MAGAKLASKITEPISIPKYEVRRTTSPAEIPYMLFMAKYAERIRQRTFAIWNVTQAAALNFPLILSSLKPAALTDENESLIAPSALDSRPCALVTGKRVVISFTLDDILSISLRKSSLKSLRERRIRIIAIDAIGATNRKKIRKLGTRKAVIITAPIKLLIAANPPSDMCLSICSMFSTSRTTLVWSAPALVRW